MTKGKVVDAEIVEGGEVKGLEALEKEDNLPSTVEQTKGLVQVIGELAINPDVSVDKMERIMAMQERVLDRNAQQDYAAAMVKVQGIIPAIKKDKSNQQTNSTYANLDSINKVIKPLYTKAGFALSFGTDGEHIPGTVRIVCEVSHIGGFSKIHTYDAPIDDKGIKGSVNKTDTHARGSAVTYGKRYLTVMIFNLTLTDEDDDGNAASPSVEPVTADQLMELEGRIDEVKASKAKMLEYYKIESLADLPATKFDHAMKTLDAKAAQDAKK